MGVNVNPGVGVNLSSTITTTGAFQSVQGKTPGRTVGIIQNNGAAPLYVFIGPLASATERASIELAVGSPPFSLNFGPYTLTDEICVTGTAGDTFFAYTAS